MRRRALALPPRSPRSSVRPCIEAGPGGGERSRSGIARAHIAELAHEVKDAHSRLWRHRMSAEQHVYPPSAAAAKNAWVSGMRAYQALVDEASRDYEGYWARLA